MFNKPKNQKIYGESRINESEGVLGRPRKSMAFNKGWNTWYKQGSRESDSELKRKGKPI